MLGAAVGRFIAPAGRATAKQGGKTSITRTAAGYGLGNALFGGSNDIQQPSQANAGRSGGVGAGFQGGSGMSSGGQTVSASQATSTLSDVASKDPVVNQLQDIEKVLVNIKGDTAIMASGLSGQKGPAVESEDSIRNRLGMSAGGSKGIGATGAAVGGLAAGMFAGGFFDSLFGDDDKKEVETIAESVQDAFTDIGARISKAALSVVDAAMNGLKGMDKLITSAAVAVTKIPKTVVAAKNKLTGTAPKLDPSGKPKTPTPTPDVVGTTKDGGKPVVQSAKGNLTIAGVDGQATTQTVDVKDVKIQAPEKLPAPDPKKMAPAVVSGLKKFGMKAVPLAGMAIGGVLAIKRLFEGDLMGASLEASGMFVPSIAGSVTIDAGILARDVYNGVYGTEENPRPHDAHALAAAEGADNGYGDNYAAILEYVQGKIGEMMSMSSEGENVKARPEKATGSGANRKNRNLKRKQQSWDEKFGDTHNADGTPKGLEMVTTPVADLVPQSAPADTSAGSVTISETTSDASAAEFARNQSAAAAGQQELATTVAATTAAATQSNVSGPGRVEKIGVYKDTSNVMVNPDTKMHMIDS